MAAQQESPEARLDDLRRRLYRADATDADLRRYLAEQQAVVPPPDPVVAPQRPRRRLLPIGIALAASVLVVGLLAQLHAQSAPRAQTVQVDVGDGRTMTVDGVARAAVPVAVVIGDDLVVGQRFQGYGSATVTADAPEGALAGGRAQIALTSTDPASVSWSALIVVSRLDESSYPVMAAQGVAEERSGAHAPTEFVYPNRPPTRIAVKAPPGVGWTLVVAFRGGVAR